jgi:hypothetical protein
MDASNRTLPPLRSFSKRRQCRTDLYAPVAPCAAISIELIGSLGAKFTPELKGIDQDSQGTHRRGHGFGESGLTSRAMRAR